MLVRVASACLLSLAVAGCGEREAKAPAASTAAPSTSTVNPAADVHRFRIGAFEAVVLRDGALSAPNDNSVFGVGRTPAEVAAVLSAAGAPTDAIPLSLQTLIVRSGDRLVMFDAGGGPAYPDAGKLAASLRTAGISPDDITDIVISHSHGDHVGGLLNETDALAFPNASIHMATAEWASLKAQQDQSKLVRTIAPKVNTLEPGAEVSRGMTTYAIPGHTPGHMGTKIVSEGQTLLVIGDAAHSSIVSLAKPDWVNSFDGDAKVGPVSRRALLTRAAEEKATVFSPHFPFPGVGQIRREGEGFAWTPA